LILWDTHCHLGDAAFGPDREAVLRRAGAAGLEAAVVVGADPEAWVSVAALRQAAGPGRPALAFAFGIHPHVVETVGAPDWDHLEARLSGAAALGEIGLDYHRGTDGAALQRAALERQLRMADRAELPVILHERDAAEDVLAVVEATGLPRRGGVWHCFSGGPDVAARARALGLHLGFGGLCTFRRGTEALREAARQAPAGSLLLETDAPYLSPEPHRGRRNEPARVADVAAFLAALRGEEPEALAAATTENARRLFGGPPS
jgi:TatD DNase family protein